MRTTIDLPDPLFRRMKEVAAQRGSTIKELVEHAVEQELATAPAPQKKHRVKLPLIRGAGSVLRSLSREEIDEFMFG